jgi:hypothetical protein
MAESASPSRALVRIDRVLPVPFPAAGVVVIDPQALTRIGDRLAAMELRMDRMLVRMDATLTRMESTLTRIERSLDRLQAVMLLIWLTTMLLLFGSVLRWWR